MYKKNDLNEDERYCGCLLFMWKILSFWFYQTSFLHDNSTNEVQNRGFVNVGSKKGSSTPFISNTSVPISKQSYGFNFKHNINKQDFIWADELLENFQINFNQNLFKSKIRLFYSCFNKQKMKNHYKTVKNDLYKKNVWWQIDVILILCSCLFSLFSSSFYRELCIWKC